MTQYFCASSRRRDEVRQVNFLNGIDFIEVAPADQRTLFVHFIHPVAGLTKNNFRIAGGVRVKDVQVQALVSTVAEVVTLRTSSSGDFSRSTGSNIDNVRVYECSISSSVRGSNGRVSGERRPCPGPKTCRKRADEP